MKFGIRELIFVCVMVGLLVCTYFFVFKRANEKRALILADIETKNRTLLNLEQATAGIPDMNNKMVELQQAIAFFESKLPKSKEVDKILDDVTKLVRDNNLQTKTFKTLKTERDPSYSEQPIQMTLSGDFKGFYSFLLQLEKLQRLTRINDMTLQKINDRNGEMQAQLTLSIFFEPDSATNGTTTNGNFVNSN